MTTASKATAPKTFCTIRQSAPKPLPPTVGGERARLILEHRKKWANGTTLKYAFFSTNAHKAWLGTDALRAQVRAAMKQWTDLGIGISFSEVSKPADAEVRIGFKKNDGHWSYIARDVLNQGADDRTMNLDPDDGVDSGAYGVDVATHELGHTLGLPHEHQNPIAGIVWNEAAVYASLGAPPNNWDQATTFSNILSKIPVDDVQGSSWDPDSIMHYPFEKGLIVKPEKYANGLTPKGGLSPRDKEWIQSFYPALPKEGPAVLPMLASQHLLLGPGEQRDFLLEPTTSRNYEIRTFGAADTIVLLYERAADGSETFLKADDDSGEDRNAQMRVRLKAGRKYSLKIRLYYAEDRAETAVMWW